jgi:hypothetical protein
LKTKKEVKIKKINNSNTLSELSNSRTFTDMVLSDSFNLFPGKDEWRQRLIFTLYKWAYDDTKFELMQFCYDFKISRSTLYEWRSKYEDINKAVACVLLILGMRRRLGALHGVLKESVVFKDMYKYDPEFIEINKYWSDLQKESGENKTQVVILDKFPEEDK